MAAASGENQFGFPTEATVSGVITVLPTPNRSAVTFRTVTVFLAGTPMQGPSVVVPDSFTLLVKVRTTNAGSPTLYVSNSPINTGVSTNRQELKKGEAIGLKISNMDLLWFDSDTNGTVVELVAEQ